MASSSTEWMSMSCKQKLKRNYRCPNREKNNTEPLLSVIRFRYLQMRNASNPTSLAICAGINDVFPRNMIDGHDFRMPGASHMRYKFIYRICPDYPIQIS